jgi:hypothetical protein
MVGGQLMLVGGRLITVGVGRTMVDDGLMTVSGQILPVSEKITRQILPVMGKTRLFWGIMHYINWAHVLSADDTVN